MKFKPGDKVILHKDYPITKTGWTGTVIAYIFRDKSKPSVTVSWDDMPDHIAALITNNELTVEEEHCSKLSKLHQILK